LKSSGGVQPNLNLGIISDTAFPLGPLQESEFLVEEIESKISVIDQLEQTIVTALQQAEALRQSILKKAFAGQLVPQDPNDETAAALLARIRAGKVG
jgi:type I restriction enzyme S subunit